VGAFRDRLLACIENLLATGRVALGGSGGKTMMWAMDDKAKDEYNRMLGTGRAVNLENAALQNDHSFELKAFLMSVYVMLSAFTQVNAERVARKRPLKTSGRDEVQYISHNGGVTFVAGHAVVKKSELVHDYPSVDSHGEDLLQIVQAYPELFENLTTLAILSDGGDDTSLKEYNRVYMSRVAIEIRAIVLAAGYACPLIKVVWMNSSPNMSKYNFPERANVSINTTWSGKLIPKFGLKRALQVLSPPTDPAAAAAALNMPKAIFTCQQPFTSPDEIINLGGGGCDISKHPNLALLREKIKALKEKPELLSRALIEAFKPFASDPLLPYEAEDVLAHLRNESGGVGGEDEEDRAEEGRASADEAAEAAALRKYLVEQPGRNRVTGPATFGYGSGAAGEEGGDEAEEGGEEEEGGEGEATGSYATGLAELARSGAVEEVAATDDEWFCGSRYVFKIFLVEGLPNMRRWQLLACAFVMSKLLEGAGMSSEKRSITTEAGEVTHAPQPKAQSPKPKAQSPKLQAPSPKPQAPRP